MSVTPTSPPSSFDLWLHPQPSLSSHRHPETLCSPHTAKLALQMLWRLHLHLGLCRNATKANSNTSNSNNSSNATTQDSSSPTNSANTTNNTTATDTGTSNEAETQTGVESRPADAALSPVGQVDRWLRVLRGMGHFAGHRCPHICYQAMRAGACCSCDCVFGLYTGTR